MAPRMSVHTSFLVILLPSGKPYRMSNHQLTDIKMRYCKSSFFLLKGSRLRKTQNNLSSQPTKSFKIFSSLISLFPSVVIRIDDRYQYLLELEHASSWWILYFTVRHLFLLLMKGFNFNRCSLNSSKHTVIEKKERQIEIR